MLDLIRQRKFAIAFVLISVGAIAALRAHDLDRTAQLRARKHETVRPKRADFVRTVPALGEVKNFRPIVVHSDVRAWERPEIIEMVPPGSFVRKGEPVMILDASAFRRRINEPILGVIADNARVTKSEADEVIQKHRNARRTMNSRYAATLAKNRLDEYAKGSYAQQKAALLGTVKMRRHDMEQAIESLENTQRLARLGIVSNNALLASTRSVEKSEVQFELAQGEVALLDQFAHPRQMAELGMARENALHELDMTKLQNGLETAIAETSTLSFRKYRAGWQNYVNYLQGCIDACVVRAPKDGRVIYATDDDKVIEVGRTVHYMQKLFSVADQKRLSVAAEVSNRHFYALRKGQRVSVKLSAIENEEFFGELTWMGPIPTKTDRFNPDSLHHKIEILLDEEQMQGRKLFPGMTARAEIIVDMREDVLQVPIDAVVEHRGEFVVLEQSGESLIRRVVEVGASDDQSCQIVGGIDPSADVVVALPEELRDLAAGL